MKKLLSLLLAVVMVISILTTAPISAEAAGSFKMKHYMTHSMKQGDYSAFTKPYGYNAGCCAVSYAIGLSIVTGESVEPTQFWYNGTTNYTKGKIGNYVNYDPSILYRSLCDRKPVMLYYKNGKDEHWVLAIGATNNSLSTSSFICIDPVYGAERALNNCWSFGDIYGMRIFTETAKSIENVENHSPTDAWIKSSRSVIPTGASNTFTFGATNAQSYTIGIDKNGERIITEVISSGKSYTFNEEGNYTAFVSCYGEGENFINSNKISFTVFSPIVMGDSFIANIANSEVNKNINATESSNVEMQSKNSSDSQKWLFELQSDGAYKITNVAYNKCIDVYCSLTEDGTNIQVYDSNSSHAQRFYLRLNESGYSIVPKTNTDSALDITNCSYEDGANIQQWKCSLGNVAQIFTIEYVDLYPGETQIFNGKTYKYYNISMPWTQAHKFCEKSGGHLATINSADENAFILDMVKRYDKDYCWLGATDYATENNWYWIKSEELSYNNWATSQPDNGNKEEHFMAMYVHNDLAGQWNDISNNSNYHKNKIGFICEYENDINENSYTPTKTFNYNGKEYEIYEDTVDWHTAKSICEAKGGHFVTFSDTEENEAVFNAIQSANKDSYWLGYTDIVSEGEWRGVDAPHDTLSYKNWKADEPGNGSNCEDYAFMRTSSSKWEDLKSFCYAYHNIGFICEYEAEKPKLLLGDADCDGNINIKDATAIQKHIASIITLSENGCAVSDVDASDDINIKDATAIQKHIAGIDTGFPIG